MRSADGSAAQASSRELVHRVAQLQTGFRFFPNSLQAAVREYSERTERAFAGLRRRDPGVWSRDPAVQQKIANRLGWLSSPALMASSIDRLTSFADTIKGRFTDVVLLGMGGSSLAPEVLRAILGVTRGYPTLHVLDSTDPAAVLACQSDPARTIYLLASKSGTTIEPNSLAAHFRSRLEQARVTRPADHFVAITDEGTELATRARTEGFREVFINPSDIGGRYSALSFFGLVPAALMGQDIASLVAWGQAMLDATEGAAVAGNPSTLLGLLMGAGARTGRDKLTLLLPPALEPFGLWVEQLVAESTGKNGVGVVPVAGERAEPSRIDNPDRLFVAMHAPGSTIARDEATMRAEPTGSTLRAPMFAIELPEKTALGAEFVRWEIATAIAGALLEVNPFDEPNVQQAKDATRTLLIEFKQQGRLPIPSPDRTLPTGVTLTLSESARAALHRLAENPVNLENLENPLSLLNTGDYVSILAYLGPDAALAESLEEFRSAVVRLSGGVATTIGYGPRYLHSTGQLHKGGPDTGVFIIVTATPETDMPIPGESFSFATLELAQAIGDFLSLEKAGRRALHIHLPAPAPAMLTQTLEALLTPLEGSRA